MMNKEKNITNKSTNSGEVNASELGAFGRSSRIPRSPVRSPDTGPFGQSTRTPRSPVGGEGFGIGGPGIRNVAGLRGVFGQLGDQIRSLIEMLEDGKIGEQRLHGPLRFNEATPSFWALEPSPIRF